MYVCIYEKKERGVLELTMKSMANTHTYTGTTVFISATPSLIKKINIS